MLTEEQQQLYDKIKNLLAQAKPNDDPGSFEHFEHRLLAGETEPYLVYNQTFPKYGYCEVAVVVPLTRSDLNTYYSFVTPSIFEKLSVAVVCRCNHTTGLHHTFASFNRKDFKRTDIESWIGLYKSCTDFILCFCDLKTPFPQPPKESP